jgi:hypothetical protein
MVFVAKPLGGKLGASQERLSKLSEFGFVETFGESMKKTPIINIFYSALLLTASIVKYHKGMPMTVPIIYIWLHS